MLKKIQKEIFKEYKPVEKKWFFISWFNKKEKLIFSTWVLDTDKKLKQLTKDIYQSAIKKDIKKSQYILIDIVTQINKVSSKQVSKINPKKYGIAIRNKKKDTWTILPKTDGVADSKHAIKLIRDKYDIKWWVVVYRFTTDRKIISK